MSVSRVYRLALHVLPAQLRRKHGTAMEALFAQELERAHARGWPHGALAGAAGLLDVLRRGAYEFVRPERTAAGEYDNSRSSTLFMMDANGNLGELHMEGNHLGGSEALLPTPGQLLRRHAASFAVAFTVLTSLLLYVFASRQMPALGAKGASASTMAEVLLLALPFTAAMTIPMAVFIAVIHQFTRLGANGTLAAARQVQHGVRRLVVPVLAAAAGMTVLASVMTTEILPRSNKRLSVVLHGSGSLPNDRSMTIRELREAARNVGSSTEADGRLRAAEFEVEVQKKLALPVACLVLTLAAMALALRMPRGGTWLVLGASVVFFGAYYALLMTGETLADRMVVSPFVGMWGANAFVLTIAVLTVWPRRVPLAPGPMAISG